MRKSPRDSRGFTLILVVMLIAVLAMMAVSLLNLIRIDLSLVGQSRRDFEARQVAEGGAMEVLNDGNLTALLPTLASTSLANSYTPPASSPFNDAANKRTYDGSVALLRVAPVGESSHGFTRALVYEIGVTSVVSDGASTAEVRAEVYRPVAFEPGIVLPQRHYK